MSDSTAQPEGFRPLAGRQAALADIAEKRRSDPRWTAGMDPKYGGPHPLSLETMAEADFETYQGRREEERRWLLGDMHFVGSQVARQGEPPTRPQPVARACLPFGQRIRDLRRALGWTQREAALHLGVSSRSIIRYEQGHSSPLQSVQLLALRRLESDYRRELDASFYPAAKSRQRTRARGYVPTTHEP